MIAFMSWWKHILVPSVGSYMCHFCTFLFCINNYFLYSHQVNNSKLSFLIWKQWVDVAMVAMATLLCPIQCNLSHTTLLWNQIFVPSWEYDVHSLLRGYWTQEVKSLATTRCLMKQVENVMMWHPFICESIKTYSWLIIKQYGT